MTSVTDCLGFLNGWEIVLILALALMVFGVAKPLLGSRRGVEAPRSIANPPTLMLFLAQGFGAGRIRFGPGTFGSLVGLAWFALLLLPGNLWFYLAGTAAGILGAVRVCGAAERILNQTDPPSVVLDEIAAMPLCFVAWVAATCFSTGRMPLPESFASYNGWPATLGIFAAFRFFDVAKPWPVRQSQKLPGGWGITVDDVLAAAYVNLVALAVMAAMGK
jgi:phosphatidylglycerophosphatase A